MPAPHITEPRKAWTSGQWMTERVGGNDARNTETQAISAPAFAEGASTLDIDGLPLAHSPSAALSGSHRLPTHK